MAGLTDAQVDFYRHLGDLVIPDALDPECVARLGQIVDEWTARAAGVTRSDDFFDIEDSHRPDAPRVRRFKWPVRNHPEFDGLARSREVLDLLARAPGEDPATWAARAT